MGTIQILQVTSTDLAQLISDSVKSELKQALKNKLETPQTVTKEFLTREETKNFFKISYVTLHDWIRKGLITPYKMGRKTFFKRSELVASLLNSKKAV